MGLEIAQEQQGIVRILTLRGRLDTDTAADLELSVQDLLSAGERHFLIDLAEVGYVSSAGLRVLLALAKQLDKDRGSLRLSALNPSVTQVFEIAGFAKLFMIFKDKAAALASLSIAAPSEGPTLAGHVARLLGVSASTIPTDPKARELAQAVAQLLGVRPVLTEARNGPVTAIGAAPSAAVETSAKPPGFFARLFGRKR